MFVCALLLFFTHTHLLFTVPHIVLSNTNIDAELLTIQRIEKDILTFRIIYNQLQYKQAKLKKRINSIRSANMSTEKQKTYAQLEYNKHEKYLPMIDKKIKGMSGVLENVKFLIKMLNINSKVEIINQSI